MKKHMTQEVAIKSAWMILEGLGYDRARNGDLEKTVTAVYESAPAADVVELPCKIGDTVYFLQRCLDSYTFVNYGDVIAFHVYRSYITVEVNDHDAFNPFVTLDVSAFGKTVFLTRAEAEAALKGGQDDVG